MVENNDLATPQEPVDDPYADMRAAKPWLDLIADAEKCFQPWQDRCDKIDKLYADTERLANTSRDREFQIFWANLEVMKPSVYSRPPVPVVVSRFKDRKELNRHASEMLERVLITSFDHEDIDDTMILVRDDLVLYSRGVLWPRYEASEADEKVAYDHLDRKDFCHEPARKWKEVGWVARKSYLSMKKMRERFESVSDDTYLKAEYVQHDGDGQTDYKGEKKACVWELWSKEKNVVVWVTKGVEDVLDIRDPFLSLEGFFPCPRPAYGTLQPGSLVPVPDFVYYKDQVEEINELTARISALSESLQMRGFYAGGSEDVAGAIEAAMKNTDNRAILVPVPNFAALGGAKLADAIVWLPVEAVATTITQLQMLRRQLIDDVYQITGLSDIMRGATDPNETLGAQELKSQYGSIRVRGKQFELVRIARDTTRLAGEIMAENFAPETLQAMSQYEAVPSQEQVQQQIQQIDMQVQQAMADPQLQQAAAQDPQAAQQKLQQAEQQKQKLASTITREQVYAFLREQRMRPFSLEIETDSTIQPDEDTAKQRATEYMGAVGPLIREIVAAVQVEPAAGPFGGELLKFASKQFRAGRELEGAIDQFVDGLKQKMSQPKPNPEQEKAQADIKAKEQELAFRQQEHEQTMAFEGEKMAFEREKMGMERQKMEQDHERAGMEADAKHNEMMVKSGLPPQPRDTSKQQVGSIVEALKAQSEAVARGLEAVGQGMEAMAQAQMAPKRVVRDAGGAPVAIETVTH